MNKRTRILPHDNGWTIIPRFYTFTRSNRQKGNIACRNYQKPIEFTF